MHDLITWTIGGGLVVFAIGLISAFASRRQSRFRRTNSLQKDKVSITPQEQSPQPNAMSMAERGLGNLNVQEDNLAATGSLTR